MAHEMAGEKASVRQRIAAKGAARERDEAVKPLAAYRGEELSRMRRTFFGPEEPYHALRRAFVRKTPGAAGGEQGGGRRTPLGCAPLVTYVAVCHGWFGSAPRGYW